MINKTIEKKTQPLQHTFLISVCVWEGAEWEGAGWGGSVVTKHCMGNHCHYNNFVSFDEKNTKST